MLGIKDSMTSGDMYQVSKHNLRLVIIGVSHNNRVQPTNSMSGGQVITQ